METPNSSPEPKKLSLSDFLKYIFAMIIIGIGGFMTLCGGSAMLTWNGYSVGPLGILFFIPGILLINWTINTLYKDGKKRKIGKITIYLVIAFFFIIRVFLTLFPNPPEPYINEEIMESQINTVDVESIPDQFLIDSE